MNRHDTEKLLVEKAKHGNREAFDTLVNFYRSKLIHLVGHYIQDPNEALDVVQEAMLRAYVAIESFRGESEFYTWLYRITINTAKNYLKVMEHRVPDVDIDIDSIDDMHEKEHLEENRTPETLLMSNELENFVEKTFQALPKELRVAIVLRELGGLSYEQIAKALKCPIGTVRSRIARARVLVQEKMKNIDR